jgi:hypothetical protein
MASQLFITDTKLYILAETKRMEELTRIGGAFMKSKRPKNLTEWYQSTSG